MDNVLSKVASAVNQAPIELEVDIKPINRIHAALQRWSVLPRKKRLVFAPATLGTLIRISEHLLAIDVSVFKSGNVMEANFQSISKDGVKIATIIAIAATNSRWMPSRSLVRFIMTNFTATELLNTMSMVLRQMDVTSFMTTIISMRGMNVLEGSDKNEVSPMEQGS